MVVPKYLSCLLAVLALRLRTMRKRRMYTVGYLQQHVQNLPGVQTVSSTRCAPAVRNKSGFRGQAVHTERSAPQLDFGWDGAEKPAPETRSRTETAEELGVLRLVGLRCTR